MLIAIAKLLCQNQSMKISLIVPAYNEQKYIGLLLDSVLGQTRLPDEIIICDNNSTDDTVKIIKRYQSSLPIKIVSEPKKGIRFTVEKAWHSSSGDLVIRTDADCVLPSNWIKNYEQLFTRSPELSAAGGSFLASDGNIIVKILTPFVVELNQLLLFLIKGHIVLFGGNFAIRRTALEAINGYYSDVAMVQDDVLISKKLKQHNLNYKLVFNFCFTSIRRFSSLREMIYITLSILNQKFYLEKSN